MKKVIVAAAGLALVGTMATSAMAEFKFSGDARARFYLQDNYGEVDAGNTDTHWNSRARFKIEADTKGGAYVKTRVRLSEGTWDGLAETRNKNNNIYTDYAYIGVPFGPVTVEGGMMPRDITPFFFLDERADSLLLRYKNDMTTLVGFYDIQDENLGELDSNGDVTDENDYVQYGLVLNQGFNGGWNLIAAGLYQDDEVTNTDAFAATVQVSGTVGTVALTGELAYQEEGFDSGQSAATTDDGFGGFVSAAMPVGPVELLGIVGFTSDGYIIDHDDFGPFIMIGSYSQISTGLDWSIDGESIFVTIAPTYTATERLTLGAQASYIDVDAYTGGTDYDAWEIGATASYAVTDGATLNGIIGYADIEDVDDEPFGVGLSLEISF